MGSSRDFAPKQEVGVPGEREGPGAAVRAKGLVQGESMTVGTLTRDFSYYVPSTKSGKSLPIVIYLHGHGDNMRHILGKGRKYSASAEWMVVAEREGFLVFYPLGMKGPGRRGKTGWNDCRTDAKGNPDCDDVAFVRQIVDYAVQEQKGDRSRVYVTGMSNGGHMTMRVAMEMSEVVAAVAPIAALLPNSSGCNPPSQPVPILMMHGTDDPLAPFEGGSMAGDRGEVMSARETAQRWTRWNKLVDVPETMVALPDTSTEDDSTIISHVREPKPGGNAVIRYEMRGAGHTEPSRKAEMGRLLKRIQGKQNRDIEMAEAVWEFFEPRSR